MTIKAVSVVLESRREVGEKAFRALVEAGCTEDLIAGLQALIEEVVDCTGLPAGVVLALLENRLL